MIHAVKCFGIVSEAEVDFFLEFPHFFYGPVDVGNLISGSSAFSKTGLHIWKFMAHVLLKPDLGNFEYYFGKVEMSAIAQEFEHSLAIAFLWDWNENKPFPVLWPLLSFLDMLAY